MPLEDEYHRLLLGCASSIRGFLDGQRPFPAALAVRVTVYLRQPILWDVPRVRWFLPLCAALAEWKERRLPVGGTTPSPALLQPNADVAVISIIAEMTRTFCEDGAMDLILNDDGWAPGERSRLLAPLGFPAVYASHPMGLGIHDFSEDNLDAFDVVGEVTMQGAPALPMSILATVGHARKLAAVSRETDRGTANGEVQAALLAIFVQETATAAATRALAVAMLPPLLDEHSLPQLLHIYQVHYTVTFRALRWNDQQRVATDTYGRLLGAAAQKLVAAGPQALKELDAEQIRTIFHIAHTVFFAASSLQPSALSPLAAAVRCLDEGAAASSGRPMWQCLYASHALSAVRMRFEGMPAVADAASSFFKLAALSNQPGVQSFLFEEQNVTWAAKIFITGMNSVMTAQSALTSDGRMTVVPMQSTDASPDRYLWCLRCANAIMGVVPHLEEEMWRVDTPLAHFMTGLCFCRPSDDLCELDGAQIMRGSELACALAIKACKASMAALAGGRPAATMVDSEDEPNSIASALFYVQAFLLALYEVCRHSDAAKTRSAFSEAAPDSEVSEDGLKAVREAPALILRGLHALECLGSAREAVFPGQPVEGPYATSIPLTLHYLKWFCSEIAVFEDVIAPALTPAAGRMVRWLADAASGCEGHEQNMVAIERPRAMAAAAAAANPSDESVAKARAQVLAAVKDCGYTGCPTLPAPTAEGGAVLKLKSCSGCRISRFCSAQCLREDWKMPGGSHKIACRSFKAERGG